MEHFHLRTGMATLERVMITQPSLICGMNHSLRLLWRPKPVRQASGTALHVLGPETPNALSPSFVLVRGVIKSVVAAERIDDYVTDLD